MVEADVRNALRSHALEVIEGAKGALDEFWVPRSNVRADIAVIGRRIDGFEIKTDRDRLTRLPRQVSAYGRLFDRCTAVVAERHLERAEKLLPEWWGLTTVLVNGSVTFSTVRRARTNPELDPEILVRLLWRDEALDALISIGQYPDRRASRRALWASLLEAASLTRLRSIVRRALLNRDPQRARYPARWATANRGVRP